MKKFLTFSLLVGKGENMGKENESEKQIEATSWSDLINRIESLNQTGLFSEPDDLSENKIHDEVASGPVSDYIDLLAEENVVIDVCNDIDVVSVNQSSDKYFVRITNTDTGDISEIGLSELIYGSNKGTLGSIWLNLFGRLIDEDEDMAVRKIVKDKIKRGNEKEQILVYSQPGWIRPSERTGNRWIFKYLIIYPTDIKGMIKAEYSAGIGPDIELMEKSLNFIEGFTEEEVKSLSKEEQNYITQMQAASVFDADENKLITNSADRKWARFVLKLLQEHPLDRIIFGAGLSGIIRQLFDSIKDTSIVLNIVGEPGRGKTTIERLMLSAFGKPDDLMGNFTDTDNAIESIRASRSILPYVIDDRLIKIENTSQGKVPYNILENIFRESEGRVKQRYNSATGGTRTYGAIISSSVKSIVEILSTLNDDIGQNRRLIELYPGQNEIDPAICRAINSNSQGHGINVDLFGGTGNSATSGSPANGSGEASRSDDVSSNYYGFGVLIFTIYITHLVNSEDGFQNLKERYETIVKKYDDALKKVEAYDKNLKGRLVSSSKRFATIEFTEELFLESLENHLYGAPHGTKDKHDESYDVLYLLICNLVKKIIETDAIHDDSIRIRKYVKDHSAYFVSANGTNDVHKEYLDHQDKYLGIIEPSGSNDLVISFRPNNPLEKFLYQSRILAPEIILGLFNEIKTEQMKDKSVRSADVIKNAGYPDIALPTTKHKYIEGDSKQATYYYDANIDRVSYRFIVVKG